MRISVDKRAQDRVTCRINAITYKVDNSGVLSFAQDSTLVLEASSGIAEIVFKLHPLLPVLKPSLS